MPILDPRRLLTFREVARHRSFSRAAEALNLSQPAVSQQVAALERELGTRLLDRGPGGGSPTRAGELLLEHADAVAERLSLATAQLSELVAEERTLLRVGAFPSALATILPAAVNVLRARDPGLNVEIAEGPTADLQAAVRAGRLHATLAFQDAALDRREPRELRRHDLFVESFLAVLPPRHRLARRSSIRLSDLAHDAWTMPSRGGILMRACNGAGFTPQVAAIAIEPLAVRALVADGLAVTLTPQLLAPQMHGVATVPLKDGPRRDVYALTSPTGVAPAARDLLEVLRTSAGTPRRRPSSRRTPRPSSSGPSAPA